MKIIPMNESHVAQVAELEKLCFSDPWSENSVASELSNPLSLWLIAEKEGTVCGYVGSQTVLDETDMMNIAVRPDCRCKGIAAALITELVDRLKDQGSRILRLEVRESNAPAIALYEAMGFIQLGLRKNYYRNPRENALILGKEWEI
ncbi:MAG: ribosomal protein S18-alanine N-acetyltransferase [Eubacteriales bacterium]|nr:ribosomal protein S18-alanine N-acetyltransferase [Eubacteriales bacterium]